MGNRLRLIGALLLIGISCALLLSSPRVADARLSDRFAKLVGDSDEPWLGSEVAVVVYLHDVGACKSLTLLSHVTEIADRYPHARFMGIVEGAVSDRDLANFAVDPVVRLPLMRLKEANSGALNAQALGSTAVVIEGEVSKTFILRSTDDLADLSRYISDARI